MLSLLVNQLSFQLKLQLYLFLLQWNDSSLLQDTILASPFHRIRPLIHNWDFRPNFSVRGRWISCLFKSMWRGSLYLRSTEKNLTSASWWWSQENHEITDLDPCWIFSWCHVYCRYHQFYASNESVLLLIDVASWTNQYP